MRTFDPVSQRTVEVVQIHPAPAGARVSPPTELPAT